MREACHYEGMSASRLSDSALAHFESVLRKQRTELEVELRQQTDSLDAVRDARSDASADDEHDPDSPTLSLEWSRMSGVHREFAEKLVAVDRALKRIADGSYGLCTRRGEPIGRARLDARPAAELCIECARELEAHR